MAPQELNYYKFISADPAAQSQHVLMMLDYFGDSRAEQPQCHMVFEYLDDSLFRVFQNRRGLIEHRSVVRYTHQICKGLAFLHQTGIAHMDLSMANILLRRDEIVKICDLGCSTPAAGMLSFESEQVSTEYVRAPEVWLGGSHPGSACDIWGLGVITVALLTGTILFYVGSQDVPWKPGPVPEEKRRAARPATPEPFMRQMVVLGPPTEATWPGCSALPRFDLYVSKQEMSGTQTGVGPLGDALGNPPVVRRPLATSDRGVLLLRRLLVWTPGDRGTAIALLDDSFFDDGHWLDPACETALALASREDLVHWVRCTLRSGRQLSMETFQASVSMVGAAAARGPTNQPSDPPDQLPRSGSACGAEPEVPGPSFTVPAGTMPTDQPDQRLGPVDRKPSSCSAANADQGAQPKVRFCQCDGHCGASLCSGSRLQRERTRRRLGKQSSDVNGAQESTKTGQETPMARFCKRTALPGACEFCASCKCERSDCKSQRKKAMQTSGMTGRWCWRHNQEVTPWEEQSQQHYANASGVWRLQSSWGPSLQFVARYAYLLERIIPEDIVAFRAFCGAQPAGLVEWSGAPGSAQWCWLMLANRAKWPHAVRSLAEYLANRPHLWRSASAVDFAWGVQAMLIACDGRPMKSMHAQLSSNNGHMHSTQGLIPMAKQAGMIKELSSNPGAGVRIVELGLGRHRYELTEIGKPPWRKARVSA